MHPYHAFLFEYENKNGKDRMRGIRVFLRRSLRSFRRQPRVRAIDQKRFVIVVTWHEIVRVRVSAICEGIACRGIFSRLVQKKRGKSSSKLGTGSIGGE